MRLRLLRYSVRALDNAGNTETTTGRVMVDRDLAGEYNIRLDGPSGGAIGEKSVADAGDVNGDGRGDLIIGRFLDDYGTRTEAGVAYVVFGQPTMTTIDLTNLSSSQGFKITGAAAGDWAGASMAGIGDLNGDGLADLAVGVPLSDFGFRSNAGSIYVIWGKTSGTLVDLANLGGGGYRIVGSSTNEALGGSVASAGDVLGNDGVPDLLLGAAGSSSTPGGVYVMRGAIFTGTVDLSFFNGGGGSGYLVFGVNAGDETGYSVANAGDVNGDGRPDAVIGALKHDPGGRTDAGAAFVVFGKDTPSNVRLSSLGIDATGFEIRGAAASDFAGASVSAAGDVNGDGKADVLLGASRVTHAGRSLAGAAYVVFGKASSGPVELGALGAGGYRIEGALAGDRTGYAVAGIPDVNSDGIPDALVGAPFADPAGRTDAGAVYVVFGQRGTTASIDLAALGAKGYILRGPAAGARLGTALGKTVNTSGDGRPGFLAAAEGAAPNGRTGTGQAFALAAPACWVQSKPPDQSSMYHHPVGETRRMVRSSEQVCSAVTVTVTVRADRPGSDTRIGLLTVRKSLMG